MDDAFVVPVKSANELVKLGPQTGYGLYVFGRKIGEHPQNAPSAVLQVHSPIGSVRKAQFDDLMHALTRCFTPSIPRRVLTARAFVESLKRTGFVLMAAGK